jgi:MSHA biogenesis protein MshO
MRARNRGFTLIELVVSMAIAGVIAGFIGMFMATPMEAYFAQTRRTDLADSADATVRAFDQDVATALPNSLRIRQNGSVWAVEMLATAGSARYWQSGETAAVPAGAARELDFGAADSQFATDGQFSATVHALPPTSFHLAVDNLGTPGQDAYALSNVITPAGDAITFSAGAPGEDQVTLATAFRFVQPSPTNRVYAVTQPVSYLCDPRAQTLARYSGYAIAANQTARDSDAELLAAGATKSFVARFPTACNFTLSPETAQHGAVLSIRMTLTQGGEAFQVFHQVAVEGIR